MQEASSSSGSSSSGGGPEDESGGSTETDRAVTPLRSAAARFTFAQTGDPTTPSSSSASSPSLVASTAPSLLSSTPTTSPIATSALRGAGFLPMSPLLTPLMASPSSSEAQSAAATMPRPPSTPRRLPVALLPAAAPQTPPSALTSKAPPSIVSPIRPISTHPPPSPSSIHSIAAAGTAALSRFAPIAPFARPSPLATWMPAAQTSAFTPSSAFHQLSIVSPSHAVPVAPLVPLPSAVASRKRGRAQRESESRVKPEESTAATTSTVSSTASTTDPSPLSSQRSSIVSTASSTTRASSHHSHTLSGSSFGSLTSSPPLQLSEESSPLSSTLTSPQLRPSSLQSSQPESMLSTPHLLAFAPPGGLSVALSLSGPTSVSSSPSRLPAAPSVGLMPTSSVKGRGGHDDDSSEMSEEEEEEEDEAEYGDDSDDEDVKLQQRALSASTTSAASAVQPLTSPPRSVISAASASSSSASSSAPRRKRARTSPAIVAHFSSIECGKLDTNNVRFFYEMSAYFGKEMEIYTASIDPQKRILYRASVLADKFGCATNKVGMYLARRRQASDGLYQATNFLFKPMGRTGLKSGGYFLSLDMCKAFERHFIKQTSRKRMRHQGEVMMNMMKMGLLNAAVPATQAAAFPMAALGGGGLVAAQQQAAMTAQLQMHMHQEFTQQMLAAAAQQQQRQHQHQQQQQQQQASLLSMPYLMSSQGAAQPFLHSMSGQHLSGSTLSSVAEEGGFGSLSSAQLQQLHQAGLLQPNMLHNPPPPSLPPSSLLTLAGRQHSATQLMSPSSSSLPPFPHPNVALLSPSQAGLLSSLPSAQQLPVAPLVPQSPSASVVPLAAPTPRAFASLRSSPAPRVGQASALSATSVGASAAFPFSSLGASVFPPAVPPSPRYVPGIAPLGAAVMSAVPVISLSASSAAGMNINTASHMLPSAASSVGTPSPPLMSAQSQSPPLSSVAHKPAGGGPVKRASPAPHSHH